MLHVIFRGRVQGVGFRATVARHARRWKVTGTAQNREDGSVEVYACGSREKLDGFLSDIKKDSGAAVLQDIDYKHVADDGCFEDFRIF